MIYKQKPDNIRIGDPMSCLECGPRIVKNGHESTKMRGKMQRGHRLQKNEVLEESC